MSEVMMCFGCVVVGAVIGYLVAALCVASSRGDNNGNHQG